MRFSGSFCLLLIELFLSFRTETSVRSLPLCQILNIFKTTRKINKPLIHANIFGKFETFKVLLLLLLLLLFSCCCCCCCCCCSVVVVVVVAVVVVVVVVLLLLLLLLLVPSLHTGSQTL